MPAIPADIQSLIGRAIMVGIRGASPGDAALRDDLAACRAARCRAVILFDVDAPSMHARIGAGASPSDARALSPRNILSPDQLRELNAHIKETLGPGTIIAVDQEGGEVARLAPARGFPCTLSAEAFAALTPDRRAHEAAAAVHSLASFGFNLNFAPCIDLALNPDNPVIARKRRAFSADPAAVTDCARTVLLAHHAAAGAAVRACLKHFPGHGSSAADSHLGFTDITNSWRESLELDPYHALLRDSPRDLFIMTGHLFHAGLDPDHPASLSRAVTTGLLRERLGFNGPVVTDSLDMRAITDRYSPGDACVRAFNAGADLLLDANNLGESTRPCPAPAMAEALARALRDGAIEGADARLRESASRIDAAMGFVPARA